MKKVLSVALLLVFSCLLAGVSLQAEEKIIVPGEPPITAFAVDCHIRLLEFVLTTRLTVAQKESFQAAIAEECAEMSTEEKQDFLEAVALVDSLSEADEETLEEIQGDLEEDFQKTAAEVPEDAAAQLFSRLQKESTRKVLEDGEIVISVQAVEGFVEYLAFLSQPDQPVWYDASATAAINDTLIKNFAAMSKEEKESLEDFQITWYMIRAAWQNVEDQQKKDAWRKVFSGCGVKSGEAPDVARIKVALSDKIYGEMLDEASGFGVEPFEWAAELAVRVW
ncbi:MAG: hypothetical protein A2W80_12630 [Candidatus Riflebacteria bacterium GWC2_50_8]|nr:MAG: hypothetical protein A2W80_12630 [Candidatus Riflebacteria bacterium GWC2_50_8]